MVVLVYEKRDIRKAKKAALRFHHAIFVSRKRTGDFQTTFGLRNILNRNGNIDDVTAFLEERNLPLDEIGRRNLAEGIMEALPILGYLTISNALQWRLQYGRVIEESEGGEVKGLEALLD